MKVKKLHVMGYDIKIRYGHAPSESKADATGFSSNWRNYIWIEKEAAGRGEVVLHEILHLLENRLALHLSEDQVRSLSYGLAGVIRDNPKFVELLQSDK